MGVYPESFLRPMRNDVGRLLVRLERVAPAGDSKLTLGKGAAHMDHGSDALMISRFAPLLPELILSIGGTILMMVAAFSGRRGSGTVSWLAVVLLLAATARADRRAVPRRPDL